MLVVERHHVAGTDEIVRLCALSKELYNKCNFLMRRAWFSGQQLPDIGILVRETQTLDCFKLLHNTKTAKQTIRRVLSDWSTFRKSLVAFKRNPKSFRCKPRPPHYKDKLAQVTFYNETIRNGQTGRDLTEIIPTNNCFRISSTRKFKQVVITPKTFGFIIDVQYERHTPKAEVDKKKACAIDVGVNVLAAITSDQLQPVLVNGRILKSINQRFNKAPNRHNSRKRYFQIENYFHHVSKFIVDWCIQHRIGKIIVGRSKGWKQNSNMGKLGNQQFQYVPFHKLLQKIQYKAEAVGIEVVFTEEAYTSKANFFAHDPLPVYEKGVEPPTFSGRRKHRGLYVTDDGFAVNADVNGSLNVGRKVIPKFFGIEDRSLAARPVRINPLKAFCVQRQKAG